MDVVIAGLIYRVRSFPRHHRQRAQWRAQSAVLLDTARAAAVREGVAL